MSNKNRGDAFDAAANTPGARVYTGATIADAVKTAQQELGAVRVAQGRRLRRGGIGGLFAEDLGVEIVVFAEQQAGAPQVAAKATVKTAAPAAARRPAAGKAAGGAAPRPAPAPERAPVARVDADSDQEERTNEILAELTRELLSGTRGSFTDALRRAGLDDVDFSEPAPTPAPTPTPTPAPAANDTATRRDIAELLENLTGTKAAPAAGATERSSGAYTDGLADDSYTDDSYTDDSYVDDYLYDDELPAARVLGAVAQAQPAALTPGQPGSGFVPVGRPATADADAIAAERARFEEAITQPRTTATAPAGRAAQPAEERGAHGPSTWHDGSYDTGYEPDSHDSGFDDTGYDDTGYDDSGFDDSYAETHLPAAGQVADEVLYAEQRQAPAAPAPKIYDFETDDDAEYFALDQARNARPADPAPRPAARTEAPRPAPDRRPDRQAPRPTSRRDEPETRAAAQPAHPPRGSAALKPTRDEERAEPTWGPQRNRMQRLCTADDLVNLGLPDWIARDCVDVEELTALMRAITPGVSMLPPRGISALVGDVDTAWKLADELFDRVLVFEKLPTRGIKALQDSILRHMSKPGTTGVVIGADDLGTDTEALRRVVAAIRPIEVRVVADASWSENRIWQACQMPGRLVMDLVNINNTGRPCMALRAGIPVVSLNGRPADEYAWTDLVLRRLGKSH